LFRDFEVKKILILYIPVSNNSEKSMSMYDVVKQ